MGSGQRQWFARLKLDQKWYVRCLLKNLTDLDSASHDPPTALVDHVISGDLAAAQPDQHWLKRRFQCNRFTRYCMLLGLIWYSDSTASLEKSYEPTAQDGSLESG